MFPFFFNHSQKELEDKKETSDSNKEKEKQETKSLFPFKPSLFQNKSPIFETAKKVNQNQQSPSRKAIPLSCNVMTAKASPSISRSSVGALAFLKNEAKSKFISQNKPTEKSEHINNKDNNSQKKPETNNNENPYQKQNTPIEDQNNQNKLINKSKTITDKKIKSKGRPRKKELDLLSKNTDIYTSFNIPESNGFKPNTEIIKNNKKNTDNSWGRAQKNENDRISEKIPAMKPIEKKTVTPKPIPELVHTDNNYIQTQEVPKQIHKRNTKKTHSKSPIIQPENTQSGYPDNNSEKIQEEHDLIPIKKPKSMKKNNLFDMVALDVSSDSNKSDDLDDTYFDNSIKSNYLAQPRKTRSQTRKEKEKEKINNNQKNLYGNLNMKTRSYEKKVYNKSEVNSIHFYFNKPFVYYNDDDNSDDEIGVKKNRKKTNLKNQSNNKKLNEIINPEESSYTEDENQIPQIENNYLINSENLETNQQNDEEIENTTITNQQDDEEEIENPTIENQQDDEKIENPNIENQQGDEETENPTITNQENDEEVSNPTITNQENANQIESIYFMSDDTENNDTLINIFNDISNDTHNIANENTTNENTVNENTANENTANENTVNEPKTSDQNINLIEKDDQTAKSHEDKNETSPPTTNANSTNDDEETTNKERLNLSFYPSQILNQFSKEKESERPINQSSMIPNSKSKEIETKQQNKLYRFDPSKTVSHDYLNKLSKYLKDDDENDTKSDEKANETNNEYADYIDSPSSSDKNNQTPKNSISTPNLSNASPKHHQFIIPHQISQSPSTYPFEKFLKKRTNFSEENTSQTIHSIPNSKSVDNSLKSLATINTTEKAINRLLEISKNIGTINSDDENEISNSKNSKNSFIPPFFKENHPKPASLSDNDDTSKYNEFERAIFSAGKKSKWQLKKHNDFIDFDNNYNDDDKDYQPPQPKKKSNQQTKKNQRNVQKSPKKVSQKKSSINNSQKDTKNQMIDNIFPDNEIELELENVINEMKKDNIFMNLNIPDQNDVNFDSNNVPSKKESNLPKFMPNRNSNHSAKSDKDDVTLGMVISELVAGKRKRNGNQNESQFTKHVSNANQIDEQVKQNEVENKEASLFSENYLKNETVNDNHQNPLTYENQQNFVTNENNQNFITYENQHNFVTNNNQQSFVTNENKQNSLTNENHQNPLTYENQQNFVTNENQQNLLTNENQQNSLTTENQQNFVTNNNQQSFVTNENQQNYVTNENQQNYVTNENQQNFVTYENQQNFVTNENQQNLLTNENQQNSLTNENQQNFVTNNNQQSFVTNENQQNYVTNENQQNLITNESQKVLSPSTEHEKPASNRNQENSSATTEAKQFLSANENQEKSAKQQQQSFNVTSSNEGNLPVSNENKEISSPNANEVKKSDTNQTENSENRPRKKITDIISSEILNEMQKVVNTINNDQPEPQFEPEINQKFEKEVMKSDELFEKSLKPMSPE